MGAKRKTPPQDGGGNGNHGADGRFVEGNRANPGGHPKVLRELRERIRERGLDLVEKLFAIAWAEPRIEKRGRRNVVVGPTHLERIQAIKLLMAYGYGRPTLAVEVSGPGGGPVQHRDITQLNSSERRQRIDELLAKAAGVPGAANGGAPAGQLARAVAEAAAVAAADEDDREEKADA
jgi:hypothetical protein